MKFTETDNGVEASIVRNNNVEKFIIQGPNSEKNITDVGDRKILNDGDGYYVLLAVLNDDTKEVIQSTTVSTQNEEMPIRINREASEDFEEDKFIIKQDESLNGVIDVNQDVSTITVDLVTTGIQFDEQIINVENEDNVNFELKEEGGCKYW